MVNLNKKFDGVLFVERKINHFYARPFGEEEELRGLLQYSTKKSSVIISVYMNHPFTAPRFALSFFPKKI